MSRTPKNLALSTLAATIAFFAVHHETDSTPNAVFLAAFAFVGLFLANLILAATPTTSDPPIRFFPPRHLLAAAAILALYWLAGRFLWPTAPAVLCYFTLWSILAISAACMCRPLLITRAGHKGQRLFITNLYAALAATTFLPTYALRAPILLIPLLLTLLIWLATLLKTIHLALRPAP